MHDNTLTPDNRDRFNYIAGQYGQLVKFYNVEELCADRLAEIRTLFPTVDDTTFSIGAMYRLMMPQILPPNIEKIIYLDSDIVVNLDISELWRIELGDRPLAAVTEEETDPFCYPTDSNHNYLVTGGFVGYHDYFNSGVLLLNLDYLRSNEALLLGGMKFVSEHPQLGYFDQDVLNYLFAKNNLKLPATFNAFVRDERGLEKNPRARRKIYHYTYGVGGNGLNLDLSDEFNRLWFEYFMRTPWFGAEVIGRLYASYRQMVVDLKRAMIITSAVMSGKTRAFFGYPQSFDALKELFAIREDELLLPADEPDALQKLLAAMNASRGEKVFFILQADFPFQTLADAGLMPNVDFVSGFEFLSEANGIPLNSYGLIKTM